MQNSRINLWIMGFISTIILIEPAIGQDVILPAGSTWKYLDDGTDQGIAWTEPGFNDSKWKSGLAPLGYGNGDEDHNE